MPARWKVVGGLPRGRRASRNWDSNRRLRELDADGIVAEVLFPNTIPPFFPKSSLVHHHRAPERATSNDAGPAFALTIDG